MILACSVPLGSHLRAPLGRLGDILGRRGPILGAVCERLLPFLLARAFKAL